jgi:hypothetical protein
MTHLLLLAQLSGPWCGQYGSTPFNNGTLGCTVPNSADPWGTRLIEDPFAPGGVRAKPAREESAWTPPAGYPDP